MVNLDFITIGKCVSKNRVIPSSSPRVTILSLLAASRADAFMQLCVQLRGKESVKFQSHSLLWLEAV